MRGVQRELLLDREGSARALNHHLGRGRGVIGRAGVTTDGPLRFARERTRSTTDNPRPPRHPRAT